MQTNLSKIDVHHHFIPQAWRAEAAAHGQDKVAGAPLPEWSPELSMEIMDKHDIGKAILSLSAPGVYYGDKDEAIKVARQCNEEAARVSQQYGDRFGYFAVTPMPFTEEACAEATYALDNLGATGVVLLGSTTGIYLGDPQFEELMAELDRRNAVVFIHPNINPSSKGVLPHIPGFFAEFLVDTTRAAMNLILSGTIARYPNIKFILSHAGGFLPYIAWRLSLADHLPQLSQRIPDGMLSYIKQFYFDTALSTFNPTIQCLKELVGIDHILFGSDYPFAPALAVQLETDALANKIQLSEDERAKLYRANALQLLKQ